LFQGEEWGALTPFLYFTDHENEELGRLVAEGRSREFSSFRRRGAVPNPQELATFSRSKLDWTELSAPAHAELYEWHRQLIQLRQAKMRVRAKAAVRFDAESGWLTVVHGGLLSVFNFAPAAQRVVAPRGEWEPALRSDVQGKTPADDVPGLATLIYRRRAGAEP
jgi:maltooligosyltrehalose trehalohydrolase